jgi:twitching motility protein PilT
LTLDGILQDAIELGGSDLHLSAGSPPRVRVNGRLHELDRPVETAATIESAVDGLLNDRQRMILRQTRELDFAFESPGSGRFRCNVFVQKGAVAAVFRAFPAAIPTFDELMLPRALADLAERPHGLVLVTGPTGCGKSTTVAAIIDRINRGRPVHILTIEDPIEYVHTHKLGLVNQREVAADTMSFAAGLRAAMREDPDVVFIGEMRDLETMESALTLAGTGHLTLATLHTNSAAEAVTRLVDAFPVGRQAQVRTHLSLVIEGIACQQLVPRSDGVGRVAAVEILVATTAIRSLIRDDKLHQIYGLMQAGQERHGMQTMNQALARLVHGRAISRDAALLVSPQRDELLTLVERGAVAR